MDHINIITQEAITQGLAWPSLVIDFVGIFFAISALLVLIFEPRDWEKHAKILIIHAAITIPLMILSGLICNTFFPVETGHYKYTGTFDDDMTILEFVKFQEAYTNIEYKDGIWYWEN